MKQTRATLAAAFGLCVMSAGAFAQTDGPVSAIPWLSDSLSGTGAPEAPPRTAAPIEAVTVKPLAQATTGSVGLLEPETTGLPSDLWRGLSDARIEALIASAPTSGVPAARALLRQILLAKTAGTGRPQDQSGLLLARIDKLLQIGALSEAQALIELAGAGDADFFRRWFDIGLLTGQPEAACNALSASPMLSPSRSVKVFCLAVRGDWDAAGTALSIAENLEEITPDEADLLAFYLDESLLEEMEPPPIGDPLTTLEFVIRETVGLPRPNSGLPLAFLHAELADYIPLRFRIEAAEVLVRSGVLPSSVLFAAYREDVPAASGGLWERMAAAQSVDAAATAEEITEALLKLDSEFKPVGLRLAAAEEYLLYLSALPADRFAPDARDVSALYLILGGAPEKAGAWLTYNSSAHLRTALSLAEGRFDTGTMLEDVFATSTPERYLSADQLRMLTDGRIGEALLSALALIAPGDAAEPDDLRMGLALLRATGQERAARQIAIETLLLNLDLWR